MKMALDDAGGVNVIKSYETGRVQIRERYYTRSLIVLPRRLFPDWGPVTPGDLKPVHLETIVEQRPEVLIIGTGETQVFPDPAVFTALMERGIGFEIMDNGAACRTYNILLAEERRAALALILTGVAD
jgi:uncharacterized protein